MLALLPGLAAGQVIVPVLAACLVSASCHGLGPWPDLPVAAEYPARYPRVDAGVLQAAHRFGADADDVVAVPDRIAGGLDPGHPGVPGPVSLVLLPAQQVPDAVPGEFHDRR